MRQRWLCLIGQGHTDTTCSYFLLLSGFTALGSFLEHGHRLLGASVGVISLVLAAVAWKTRQSPAVRWLVVAAVFLVVLQGLLGGLRVLLDDKTVAKIHACTGAAIFFSCCGHSNIDITSVSNKVVQGRRSSWRNGDW